ncbi:MAG TPA: hypothetical protein VGN31_08475 [Paraburkholderia sp.]
MNCEHATVLPAPTRAAHSGVLSHFQLQLGPQMMPHELVRSQLAAQFAPQDCEAFVTSCVSDVQLSPQTVPQRFKLKHAWLQPSPLQPR